MSNPETLSDVLKAYLDQENLMICREVPGDPPQPLEGVEMAYALREIGILIQDVAVSTPQRPTREIPVADLEALIAESRR